MKKELSGVVQLYKIRLYLVKCNKNIRDLNPMVIMTRPFGDDPGENLNLYFPVKGIKLEYSLL